MNIVVRRRPQSLSRVQACKQARGISTVLLCPKTTVCFVSVGTLHAAQSYLGPPSRRLHGDPRIFRCSSSISMEHGAFQNVLRRRQQNFATGYGRPLPVRQPSLSDINRGEPSLHRRRHGFDGREMASGPDQTIGRTSRRDDCSLRAGIPGRSSSINPPVGRADHRARKAG